MQRIHQLNQQLCSSDVVAQEPTTISFSGKNNCIGIISIFQNETYNALTPQMRESLVKSFRVLESDPNVKVVCLRSLHPKVFCAGANIKEFEHATHAQWTTDDKFKEIDLVLRYYSKPIIVAVHKLALGGGFEIALHADIILCAMDTEFGLPEIKLGLFPGIGGTLVSKTIGK